MNGDNTTMLGFAGAWLSLTLGQWSDVVGIAAGALTCAFVVWRMLRYSRNRDLI